MDSEEIPKKVLTSVREVLVPRVLALTHPVVAQHSGGNLELLGSGVVVDTGQARYVLTASHLINRLGGARLMIGVGNEMHEVRGRRWCVTTAGVMSGSDRDRADVTVIRVDGALAAEYPPEAVTPLAAVEIDPAPDIRNPVLLLGYPCSKNTRAFRDQAFEATSYAVIANEIDPAEYKALVTDRYSHLALSLDRKDVWQPEGGRTAPSLNGLSGSGVWRMQVYGEQPASSLWLAGVFIEHYQKVPIKHVIATRPLMILSIVARTEPGLRMALTEIGARVA